MQIFTVVDDVSYPGSFAREDKLVWGRNAPMFVKSSYLSADLGNGKWVSVEGYDVDEDSLRAALSDAIRKKLADGRVH